MKKTLLTILLACCILTSCAAPLKNDSPQPLPDTADSAEALPVEGAIKDAPDLPAPFARITRYLEDEKIELHIECFMANDRQYVNVTPELRAQLAERFRAAGAQGRPGARDVTLDRMEEIELMFAVQDAHLYVWLCMTQPDDPQCPDMLYCQIADDDGEMGSCFFDKSVYTEIKRLVEKNFEKREIALEGDHVLLRPAQDGHYVDLQEALEFDDRVVVAWESQTHTYSDLYCAVETFDLTDGKSISRYKTNEPVERMDKYTLMDGYDYRVFTSDAVTYKNSDDPAAELRVALPGNVTDTMVSFYRHRGVGSFDIYQDTLVWVDKDGIQIAGADGSNAKRLLENSVLPEALQEKAREGAVFHYALPRLMCGGAKVAATIFREAPDNEIVSDGIAVCDIASGEMYWLNPGVPQIVEEKYPVQGRYIASIRGNVTDLLDAQTGETTRQAIAFDPSVFYRSFDYKTFIYNEMGHPYGFTAWVCGAADTENRSHTLLATVDDEMTGWISQATENYAFFTARDTEGVWVAAAKYTA